MWWLYPQKPMRVDTTIFAKIKPEDYTLQWKLDGHRVILISDQNGRISIWTRQKNEMKIPNCLISPISDMKLPTNTVLDGEIWNVDKRGAWVMDKNDPCFMTFWDIMQFNGKDFGGISLIERWRILRYNIQDSEHITVTSNRDASIAEYNLAHELAKTVREAKSSRSGFIHGVVLKKKLSKRNDHPLRSVEHSDWMKLVFPKMGSGLQ